MSSSTEAVISKWWWPTKKTLVGRTLFIKGSPLTSTERDQLEEQWRNLRKDSDSSPDGTAFTTVGAGGPASSEAAHEPASAVSFISTERELTQLLSTLCITQQPLTVMACREALAATGAGGRLSLMDAIAVLERCKTIHGVWRHKLQGRAIDDELLEAFVAIGGEEGCESSADVDALRHVVAEFELSLDVDAALKEIRAAAAATSKPKGGGSGSIRPSKSVNNPSTGIDFLELASCLGRGTTQQRQRSLVESYDGSDELNGRTLPPLVAGVPRPSIHNLLSHAEQTDSGTYEGDGNVLEHSRRESDAGERWGKLRSVASSGNLKLQPTRSFKGLKPRGNGVEGGVAGSARRATFAPSPMKGTNGGTSTIEQAGILLSSMTYVSVGGDDLSCFDMPPSALEPRYALQAYRTAYKEDFESAILEAVLWLQPPVPAQLTDYVRRIAESSGESAVSVLSSALAAGPEQLQLLRAVRQQDMSWYYLYCGHLLRSAAFAAIYVDYAEKPENVATPSAVLIAEVGREFVSLEIKSANGTSALSSGVAPAGVPPLYFSLVVTQGAAGGGGSGKRRKSTIVGTNLLEQSGSFKVPTALTKKSSAQIQRGGVSSAGNKTRLPAPLHPRQLSPIPHATPSSPSPPPRKDAADTMKMFFDSIHSKKSRGPSIGGIAVSGNFDRDYKSICDRYKSKKYRDMYRQWLHVYNESKANHEDA